MCFRLQGNADLDGDGAIKVAELHEYIKGRVTKSSAFEQTPELQGDAERVLCAPKFKSLINIFLQI